MNSIVSLTSYGLAPQSESVRVEPSFGVAGNFGTWTVTYEVGASGMRPGGALRVQLRIRGMRVSATRLRQRGTIRGRIVMAWSSPIWVKKNTR